VNGGVVPPDDAVVLVAEVPGEAEDVAVVGGACFCVRDVENRSALNELSRVGGRARGDGEDLLFFSGEVVSSRHST
jgi:hypothetical protein